MLSISYNETRREVERILKHFAFDQVKAANKTMKASLGNRLSQIEAFGPCQYTYYILCKEDGEWEMDPFTWDFFYKGFA